MLHDLSNWGLSLKYFCEWYIENKVIITPLKYSKISSSHHCTVVDLRLRYSVTKLSFYKEFKIEDEVPYVP